MSRVRITGTERRGSTVAAVENEDGKWSMSLPFPQHAIRQAALVGSDRLVCLSEEAELCLIDWRSGKEIARRHLLLGYRTAKIFVTADAEFIVIYHTKSHHALEWYTQSIQVLRATSLETIVEGDAFQWQIDNPSDGLSIELPTR